MASALEAAQTQVYDMYNESKRRIVEIEEKMKKMKLEFDDLKNDLRNAKENRDTFEKMLIIFKSDKKDSLKINKEINLEILSVPDDLEYKPMRRPIITKEELDLELSKKRSRKEYDESMI